MWGGVGYNIDSAFQWKDHKTYFFKGKGFWKFNDHYMQVGHERPRPSAPVWMKCPKRHGDDETSDGEKGTRRERIISADSGSSSFSLSKSMVALLSIVVTMTGGSFAFA